jgi:hypothetical protein
MNLVVGLCRLGVVSLAILTASCSGTTGEDERRADLLDRDPLFTAEIDGVRWETSAIAGPGSGPGPGTYWTKVSRWGTIQGDPRRVVFQASQAARRSGWTVTRAMCVSAETISVDGWKQFDGFVALLSIGWNPDAEQFALTAETPPVNAGGGNQTPSPSSEADLSRSCLVTG